MSAEKAIKLVLPHNSDDSSDKVKISWGKQNGRIEMETVCRLRAMALLCRQAAALNPDRSWKLLAEAEYWEHLAAAASVH
ncbi:hypothetical protein [Bradyrhizobium sp. RT3a]|uniref:hypothetical protein n=1 Tax=unclassified Bradyrhizobium TaxID=2631580 RepID=UPI00339A0B68